MYLFFKLPPYTLVGFDLTISHSYSSVSCGDDSTRPRRQGYFYFFQ
jgi:hypothetical protein